MSAEPDPLADVPDAIEPIVAYRAWGCGEVVPRPVLRSLNHVDWEPGWHRAVCLRARLGYPQTEPHAAPAEGCTCGIYALKDLVRVSVPFVSFEGDPLPPVLIGKVQLAGKVIEHDYGYRAERARVVEILPLPGQDVIAGTFALAYGATVSHELREAMGRIREARRQFLLAPRPVPPPAPKRPRPLPPDRSNEPRSPWLRFVGRYALWVMLWSLARADTVLTLSLGVAMLLLVAWFSFNVPARVRRWRRAREGPKVKRGGAFSRGQRSVVPFYGGWGMGKNRDR